MRVLIVEDYDLARDMFRRYLEMKDFEVVAATNGLEAKMILKSGEIFDAIVTDNDMPLLTGVELIEWFRGELEKEPRTKIVMMTGDPLVKPEGVRMKYPDVKIRMKPLRPDDLVYLLLGRDK